jgi:hypothetical protein
MADFNMRTDAVDVEQIMHRIRTRIREKRGVDYTDDDVRALAAVKLERFLDPGAVRSDLVEQYQRRRPPVIFEPISFEKVRSYTFDHDTIYRSSRGTAGSLLAAIRRLLNPILKLFFNPGPMIQALHDQSQINHELEAVLERSLETLADAHQTASRRDEERDALNFEIFNNMVVEITKLGIEVKNLRMQVESLTSRLDFDERRARALEGVVQYRPGATRPASTVEAQPGDAETSPDGASPARPKRRRRRGRRRPPDRPEDAAASPAAEHAGSGSRPEPAPAPATEPDAHAVTGSDAVEPTTPASAPPQAPASSSPALEREPGSTDQ